MNLNRWLLVTASIAALITTLVLSQTIPSLSQMQHTTPGASQDTNMLVFITEPQKVDLDGVTLSFEVTPKEVHAGSLVNINMKITHTASGAPISHVDWAIIIKDPSGKEVYRTSTAHSHMGIHNYNYTFMNPGKNIVHVEVASLGPKMMGMDVPKEAQTRIFKSGDMMKSPEVDENFFFGTRSYDFVVNVGSQGGVSTVSTDMGKTVELSLSTDP